MEEGGLSANLHLLSSEGKLKFPETLDQKLKPMAKLWRDHVTTPKTNCKLPLS